MEAIPTTGDALVDALDRAYPLRNPKQQQDLSEIMYKAGQRSVVEMLRQVQHQEDE